MVPYLIFMDCSHIDSVSMSYSQQHTGLGVHCDCPFRGEVHCVQNWKSAPVGFPLSPGDCTLSRGLCQRKHQSTNYVYIYI